MLKIFRLIADILCDAGNLFGLSSKMLFNLSASSNPMRLWKTLAVCALGGYLLSHANEPRQSAFFENPIIAAVARSYIEKTILNEQLAFQYNTYAPEQVDFFRRFAQSMQVMHIDMDGDGLPDILVLNRGHYGDGLLFPAEKTTEGIRYRPMREHERYQDLDSILDMNEKMRDMTGE